MAQDPTLKQHTFPFVTRGMMCFDGCADNTEKSIRQSFARLKKTVHLPQSLALISYDPTFPDGDICTIDVTIAHNADESVKYDDIYQQWFNLASAKNKKLVSADTLTEGNIAALNLPWWRNKHYRNIIVNTVSLGIILICFFFPPGALAFLILASLITPLTVLYTAREYWQQCRQNGMSALITFGIALAYGHIAYQAYIHTSTLMLSLSMVFMTFLMPIALILCLNAIDFIKEKIDNQSLQLFIRQNLFDNIAEEYTCLTDDEKASDCSTLLQKPRAQIKAGDHLRINAGECFPIDGKIVAGNTLVDSSVQTGEADPQFTQAGENIPAGAINIGTNFVIIKADVDWQHNSMMKILYSANRATDLPPQEKPNVNLLTRYQKYIFVTIIILLIALTIGLPFAAGITLMIDAVLRNLMGIAFAICPCAIAIASAYPRIVTESRLTADILIKNKYVFDRATAINTFIFDKTGTLTSGKSKVASTYGKNIDSILPKIAALEQACRADRHPVGKAIITYATGKNSNDYQFTELARDSNGIAGKIDNEKILAGNTAFMTLNGVEIDEEYKAEIKTQEQQGLTGIFAAANKKLQGIIFIEHTLRADTISTLRSLKQQKKHLILLTGDSNTAAAALNRQSGNLFNEVEAKKTPQSKNAFVKSHVQNNNAVCYVGDGLNDSLAMRTVSGSGGISIAVSSAEQAAYFCDIALKRNSLNQLCYLPALNKIKQEENTITTQNYFIIAFFAAFMTAFIITFSFASAGMSPILMTLLMLASTTTVIFNSRRLEAVVDKCFGTNNLLIAWLASSWFYGMMMTGYAFALTGLSIQAISAAALPVIMTTTTLGIAATASIFTGGAIVTLCLLLLVYYKFSHNAEACHKLSASCFGFFNHRKSPELAIAPEATERLGLQQ